MYDPFHARKEFDTGAGRAAMYRLAALEEAGLTRIAALPYSIRVLLESVLRNCDGRQVTEDDVRKLAGWQPKQMAATEVPFKPARGGVARLYRRAGRGRFGGHAERYAAAGRRSEADQSAGSGRLGG